MKDCRGAFKRLTGETTWKRSLGVSMRILEDSIKIDLKGKDFI